MLKNRAVGRSSALHGLRFFEVLTTYSPQPGLVLARVGGILFPNGDDGLQQALAARRAC